MNNDVRIESSRGTDEGGGAPSREVLRALSILDGKMKAPPKQAVLGKKRRAVYELKSGPEGSLAYERTLDQVRRIVSDAVGGQKKYQMSNDTAGLLAELGGRLDKVLQQGGCLDDGATLAPLKEGESTGKTRSIRPRSLAIPINWYGHIRKTLGRGTSRSDRANLAAINLLAYIVYAYRKPDRFTSLILYVNSSFVRQMLQLSKNDFERALAFLADQGYITKVVIRGLVPWASLKVGAYLHVVPRLDRIRPVTANAKRGVKAP